MFCISCGKEIEEGALFCRYCGICQQETIKTGDKVFSALRCNKCGALLNKNDNNRIVCSFCGTIYSLEENSRTVQREGNISIDNAKIHVRGDDIKEIMENLEVSLLFGEFMKSQEFYDKLFISNPDNEYLYKYQLLIDERCTSIDSLYDLVIPFDKSLCYRKILQSCDSLTVSEIDKAIGQIKEKGSLTVSSQLENFLNISKSLRFGDVFEYGFIGLEPIKWKVVFNSDYEIGAIVSDKLFKKQYSSLKVFPSWPESELREWLNEDFPYLYFSDEERERLCSVSSKILGKTVLDKVSLMSVSEAEKISKDIMYHMWGCWSKSQDYNSLVCCSRYASEDDRKPKMGKIRELKPYIKLSIK